MFERFFRRGPSTFQVQLTPGQATLTVSKDESILQAALREGLPFPHNCRVGGCGECKCRLVSGQVKEMTDKSYLLSAEELQQHYILACQSRPRSDLVVEVALKPTADTRSRVDTPARLTGLQPLTGDILHLVLTLDRPLNYRAGQCVDLVVPAAAGGPGDETRRYSLASAPDASHGQHIELFIRHVPGGRFTDWLFRHARPGDTLQVQGPSGDFTLPKGERPLLCVAGGSGLAPLKALLEQAIRDGQHRRPLTLAIGARTQRDLYAQDHIGQWQRAWQGPFHVEAVLSAEPDGSDWGGRRGWLADHIVALAHGDLTGWDAALCGPPAMIDTCTDRLRAAGLPADRLHADRFVDLSNSAG